MKITRAFAKKVLPPRSKNHHKGDFGRVLIIGGSEDLVGAPILAALGLTALRSGCDLVTIAAPSKVAWAANFILPDIITKKLTGTHLAVKHLPILKKLIQKNDVLLLGPGLGQNKETKATVKKLIPLPIKKVVDADAIKASTIQNAKNTLFTPHKREYKTLLSNSTFIRVKNQLNSNVILLKGSTDHILSMKNRVDSSGGSVGMTTGGTGDVLAGVCAGILAMKQNTTLFEAACAASWIMKRAGEKLEKKYGQAMIASDLPEEIAKVIRNLNR